MNITTSNVIKTITARLEPGDDLYLSLNKLVRENNVHSGGLQVIGAVGTACVGVFDSGNREYVWTTREEPMEIASCTGNVALKEGAPFVHCHAIFAGMNGLTIAGHLGEGCLVNPTAEVQLLVYADEITRKKDNDTDLWLLDI